MVEKTQFKRKSMKNLLKSQWLVKFCYAFIATIRKKKFFFFFFLKCFFNVFLIYCLIHWKIIAFSWDNQQKKKKNARKCLGENTKLLVYVVTFTHWSVHTGAHWCVLRTAYWAFVLTTFWLSTKQPSRQFVRFGFELK